MARFLLQFVVVVCQMTRYIFVLEVLMETRARSGKSFILSLNMKTIRAKQAIRHEQAIEAS